MDYASVFVNLLILYLTKEGFGIRIIDESTNSRIIGGHEVEPHSIPYQAFLNVTGSNNSTWICGGSLITTNYVLTAGRCCDGARSIKVVLGAHNPFEEEIEQLVLESTNFTIYPRYATNVYDFIYAMDIAVVALPTPVKLTRFIQTIGLPNPYDFTEEFANRIARVSGWGITDLNNDTSYSPALLAIEHRIMTFTECIEAYFDYMGYDMCVETNETESPCVGDYGSPLTIEGGIQVGIAAQDYDHCDRGSPFVYTRTLNFVTWIKEVTDYTDQYTTSTTPSTTTAKRTTRTTGRTTTTTEPAVSTTDMPDTTTGEASLTEFSFGLLLLSALLVVKQMHLGIDI
ncbi:hypothetical protein NQ318_019662 [Aromia moschata]|uniref:Peptidase S1 domain-containing protein n=1 Tax=Aromia moschata TaxID=1265417 RepID=A0AAV8Z4K8_9CUCU|nr:hypothetical protein NQ318_019662 [Aromia moschata]